MKTSLYFHYTSRSLLRGGQRTILAVFCVAVGVMAIVALQLVGFMLQNSLATSARDMNGGDIAVTAQSIPLKQSDLAFFDALKSSGAITNYTAVIAASGFLSTSAPSSQAFNVNAVDPSSYPLAAAPTFVTPSNGSVSSLLANGEVIVSQNFASRFHKQVGDRLAVYLKTPGEATQTLHVTIGGIVANEGVFAQASNLLLISADDYQAALSAPAAYSTIYITTDGQNQTDRAVKAINAHFPLASTQTVADVLKTQQANISNINQFLEIAGLLALLIGGVGIVNTMQVLLSRRKTEIAMLKTAGYRRADLYLLFGLEAGLIGMVGGIIGAAAATGVSYIIRSFVQSLGYPIPFALNPWLIASGIAIGFVTALIFGLMPIVQAAAIRPLNVIRELPGNKSASSVALTIVLLLILSVLFCVLAIVILNGNVALGIEAVYGAFAFLLLLSLFFGLVVLIVSKLPVPERFSLKYIMLVASGIALSVLVYLALPVFGILLFAASMIGIVIVILPRSWKVSTKMALRNIGRQRARTTTTLLALFIGVFAIGVVLALGLSLQQEVVLSFSQMLPYNVIAVTTGTDTTALHRQLASIPGLSASSEDTFGQVVPGAINGQPVQQLLPTGKNRQQALSLLTSVEGYNLSQHSPNVTIVEGRNLSASDMGTTSVVISYQLTNTGALQMHLKPGDTLTFASVDGKTLVTATIVGVYGGDENTGHFGNVLIPAAMLTTLAPAKTGVTSITYMKIDLAQVNKALDRIGQVAPNATVENLADIGASFAQQLSSLMDVLIAIASLSMIAGVIIIANAVALAMLERKRELGILKSVGYTSGTVLSEVMIEYGVVGAVGAFMAALLAAGAIILLGSLLFKGTMSASPAILFGLIAGTALLAMITAALVAWGSVRARPLEVLRYE